MRFSVIFAAYKDIGGILRNIELLSRKDVEFIVAGDCLGEDDIKKLEEIGKKCKLKLVLSDKRRGKVKSVNEAAKKAEGEILLFVDADTLISDPDVLDDIEKTDGDFGGTVLLVKGNSFFERMVRIDALFMSAILMFQSKFKVSTGLHGAFFFMRRDVFEKLGGLSREIIEDADLGIRASDAGYVPCFVKKKAAIIDAPKDFRSWLKQRTRWALGGAVIAFKHFRFFLKNIIPTLVQVFTLFPLVFLFIPFALFWHGPIPFPLAFYIFGGFFFTLWTLFLSKILFYEGISLRDIILYYTVYGPLWGLLAILCLLYVIAKKGKVEKVPGWKV